MPLISILLEFLKALRKFPLRVPSELFFENARKIAIRQFDIKPNPLGLRNKKVQGPATYRPVPETCAPSCPYLTVCYAGSGNVALHARRATDNTLQALFAVAIGMVAAETAGWPVRLHVSGDFFQEGVLDERYLTGLLLLGEESRHSSAQRPWAWTYTHAPPALFEEWRIDLRIAGIEILYSDRFEPGGAVVWPFERLDEITITNAGLVRCAEQVNGTPCIACDICRTARMRGQCVVFNPHGSHKDAVLKKAQQVADDWGATKT